MGVNSFFNKIKDISVLVVGDSMIDSYVYGEIKRESPEAPVPIVNVVKSLKKLGNKSWKMIKSIKKITVIVRH